MKTKTGIYGAVVLLLAALLTTSWLLTSTSDARPASEPNPGPLVAEADGTPGVDAVRLAIERALAEGSRVGGADPVGRLASLEAPTADIDQMLAEIEAGRT